MHVTFLTPLGSAFALTALVLVAVWLVRVRDLRRVRAALGLEEPSLRTLLVPVVALAAVPCLLGVAATQPVIETNRTMPERTDAQAFVVMDISRSMLASKSPGSADRLDRARHIAEKVADELPDLPIGLAGFTDRVLPYLFPTTDRRVIDATLEDAVDIEQPPPSDVYTNEATNLNALASVAQLNYFTPAAKKRVVIVMTDGESQPVESSLGPPFQKPPRVETIYVKIGDGGERIYTGGIPEAAYKPSSQAGADLARAASLTGGKVFDESQVGQIVGAVRNAIGQGPTVQKRHEGGRRPLMPYITAL
ncbi:MAG TPA: VWA domain-containing protein, partial [Gaiellaceae bacterium]|nr:VWA domain-containing protein [Gaiellaceae bacterium]